METTQFEKMLKNNRKFTLTGLVICGLLAFGFAGLYVYEVNKEHDIVYFSNDVSSFRATKTEGQERRRYDIENGVNYFLENMYGFDEYSFKENINQALELISEKEGRQIYADFKANDLYEVLKKEGVVTSVRVDSLNFRMTGWPMSVVAYATQRINYQEIGKVATKSLETHMNIIRVPRRKKNPFGVRIVKYEAYKREQ